MSADTGDQVALGIVLMVGAIFAFSTMDMLIKFLARDYSVWLLVWTRYLGQALLATLLVLPWGWAALRTRTLPLQILRAALLFGGTVSFFFGLAAIDFATATALVQINPLFIVIGAALVLGEHPDRRIIISVVIGFLGALIIIRPGSDAFTLAALLPVAGAVGIAGYTIVTKLLTRSETIWTSFFYVSIIGTLFASAVVPFHWHVPASGDLWYFVGAALSGSIGQFLIIWALFATRASLLAPFGYTSLVFAATYGILIFAEYPDSWTITGAMIIVATGLYVWWCQTAPGTLVRSGPGSGR